MNKSTKKALREYASVLKSSGHQAAEKVRTKHAGLKDFKRLSQAVVTLVRSKEVMADRKKQKSIRKKYAKRPSLKELVDSGEFSEPKPLGEFMADLEEASKIIKDQP